MIWFTARRNAVVELLVSLAGGALCGSCRTRLPSAAAVSFACAAFCSAASSFAFTASSSRAFLLNQPSFLSSVSGSAAFSGGFGAGAACSAASAPWATSLLAGGAVFWFLRSFQILLIDHSPPGCGSLRVSCRFRSCPRPAGRQRNAAAASASGTASGWGRSGAMGPTGLRRPDTGRSRCTPGISGSRSRPRSTALSAGVR